VQLFGFFEFLLEGFDGLEVAVSGKLEMTTRLAARGENHLRRPYLSIGPLVVRREIAGSILDFGCESRDACKTMIRGV